MTYTLEFIQSPNYTPASQAKSIYGRIRTIDFGAGHWWGDPSAGYSIQGVINTFLNKARQASAHAIITANRVVEMVRAEDIAWATNNANPFTFSIEVDPQIMFKWNGGSAEQVRLANGIFETLAEYIADRKYHNLTWFPHNHWKATQCNPIRWNEVMQRAKQIRSAKDNPAPTPTPIPEWKRNLKPIAPITLYAIDDVTPLRSLTNPATIIKNHSQGTPFEIVAETWVGGHRYLVSKYAFDADSGQGFDEYELKPADPPAPVIPEWQKNIVRIDPVKLMVLVPQTSVIDLNSGGVISNIAQGTWIDFLARTTVGGTEYLISSYSVENVMPNGIKRTDVGVPYLPPANEKPEWLQNWEDIADVTMYTRLDAPLVNLLDGSTIKTIPVNTAVEIASATSWHGQKYLITKYSTDNNQPAGIQLVDLDMVPVEAPGEPELPAPEQPEIRDQLNLIVKILQAIAKFLGIKI